MRRFIHLCELLLLVCARAANAEPPPKLPAEAFGGLPSLEAPELSPNGEFVAAKIASGGAQVFGVIPLFAKTGRQMFALGDAALNWWRWVNDDWLIAGLGQKQEFDTIPIYVTRLIAIQRSSGKIVRIKWDALTFDGDSVVWTAKDGSPTIKLVTQNSIFEGDDHWPYVITVDLPTGRVMGRERSYQGVYSWVADRSGAIKAGWGLDRRANKLFIVHRPSADGAFTRLVLPEDADFSIDGFSPDGKIQALVDRDGYSALWEYDPAARQFTRKLFGVDKNDLGSLWTFHDSDQPAGVTVLADRARVQWLDPRMAELQASIDKAVAPRVADVISWSRDRSRLLINVGRGEEPGKLYYFDTAVGAMSKIGEIASSALAKTTLAPMKPVRYKARDGLEIPGYLTLPVGRTPKNLPLIVMPHGGPWARDYLGYDHWVQFLANRGYAVLQPNYRGSSGLGEAFASKGDGEWGKAMQDDVTDGVRWLAADGLVDPKRVCIMGGSYGGYAAMWGPIHDPGVYRCAIAFAGVSDLAELLRYDRRFLLGKRYNKSFRKAAPDTAAVAPLLGAARMSAPILLVHGKADLRVPVEQSRRFAAALRKAGKPVDYIEQPLGDHYLSRQEDRVGLLEATDAFLARHNPAD